MAQRHRIAQNSSLASHAREIVEMRMLHRALSDGRDGCRLGENLDVVSMQFQRRVRTVSPKAWASKRRGQDA